MVEIFNASDGDVNEMFLGSIKVFNISPLQWDVASGPFSAKRIWDVRDFFHGQDSICCFYRYP